METQASALPVTPLTDEQKAAKVPYYLTPDVKALSAEPIGGLMGWHELAVVVQQIRDGVDYNYSRLSQELAVHLGYAKHLLDSSKEESARLSLLLEEERRTGEVALKEAQERADAFRVSLIHSQQFLGQDLDTPRKQYEAKGVHTVTQRMLDDPKFGFYNPLIAQAFPAPAAPCQRDCQKCASPAVGLWGGICRCTVAPAEYREGDTHCTACKLPFDGGGAGVGLQGEEGGGNV